MVVGGYETVKLLGSGGMSDVYEVIEPRLGSRHALKLFTKSEDDAESRERFLSEGRLLAKLNHPRIVKVMDCGIDKASGRPYFVMELILNAEGTKQALDEVESGTVDEETVGRWYDDLREGLAYIHAQGVVHRDLKLQNVLIGPDGHAVLTDFGISRIFDVKGDGNRVIDTVQTIVRMREGRSLIMGSIGYMAPELEMGLVATPASDWYALGVIVYKLLTGTWCDARTDVQATLETYDPVWHRIIPRLLHANPEGRECLSYAEEKTADREAAEFAAEERWLREKRRGHLARHVARWASALVVILALSLAYVLMRHSKEDLRATDRPPSGLSLVETLPQGTALSFDELFRIPAEAGADEQLDDEGNVVMPSRTQFEASRIDALVLTQEAFASVNAGVMTPETFVQRLESFKSMLDADSMRSPFEALAAGDGEYMPIGDDEVLARLLDIAIERMGKAFGE